MEMAIRNTSARLDYAGIFLSAVCGVHCLLVPLILPVLTTLNMGFFASEVFEHWSWIVTFGICALVTIVQFSTHHKQIAVFIPLFIGFLLMQNKEIFGETLEPYVAVVVGLFLIGTHLLNLKFCKDCPKCQAERAA